MVSQAKSDNKSDIIFFDEQDRECERAQAVQWQWPTPNSDGEHLVYDLEEHPPEKYFPAVAHEPVPVTITPPAGTERITGSPGVGVALGSGRAVPVSPCRDAYSGSLIDYQALLKAHGRDILKFFELITKPGDVFEIRAFEAWGNERGQYACTYSGYFDHGHLKDAVKEAIRVATEGTASATCFTLNTVQELFLSKAGYKVKKARSGGGASAENIVRLRLLLVDRHKTSRSENLKH